MFWRCWVVVAACRLSSYSKWPSWLTCSGGHSLVLLWGAGTVGSWLCGCGLRLNCSRHVESARSRDRTHVPCVGSQFPNSLTAREVLLCSLLKPHKFFEQYLFQCVHFNQLASDSPPQNSTLPVDVPMGHRLFLRLETKRCFQFVAYTSVSFSVIHSFVLVVFFVYFDTSTLKDGLVALFLTETTLYFQAMLQGVDPLYCVYFILFFPLLLLI